MQSTDSSENHRLLIIDDNPAIHEDFRKILVPAIVCAEAQGADEDEAAIFGGALVAASPSAAFEMDSAFQGQEGLVLIRRALEEKRPYAMAFVDVRMPPGWDGIETIVRIWNEYPDLQVVVCTAYSDYGWEEMLEKLGHSDRLLILKKPFDTIEVQQLAHALTEKWRLSLEVRSRLNDLEVRVCERTRELLALNDKLREQAALLDKATDAILVGDLDGKILYLNPSAKTFYGWDILELTALAGGAPIYKDPSQFDAARTIVLEKGDWSGELAQVARGGSGLIVQSRWTLLRDHDGNPESILFINTDIAARKQAEAALEKVNIQLRETSRQAGMAEVATSVLHNVGNVLNSVNVASSCLADSLRNSKAANLSKVVALMREREADLGVFITSDPKGKHVLGFLAELAKHLDGEQSAALNELAQLQKDIEHIKDIVTMQQSFAKVSGLLDTLPMTDVVEDALRMNLSSFTRHEILVIKEFEDVPPVMIEKHKVLQILVNLVRNAKNACDDSGRQEKRLTIRVSNEENRVRIAVSDNGVGIPPENLARIFAHGFTTKKDGHGFGLHSGALAAKEMGGSLSVQSEGAGQGATFTLELPLHQVGRSPAFEMPHPAT